MTRVEHVTDAARLEQPESAARHDRPPPLLRVRDLVIVVGTVEGVGPARVVDGVTFEAEAGKTLAIIGESGAGKSVLASSLLGLLPASARVESGQIEFRQKDLLRAPEADLRALRGGPVAFLPQDATAGLDPLYTIGSQLVDVIRAHRSISIRRARAEALEALRRVGMPGPELHARRHPHQLSFGMRQQALLAMALVNEPALLIADEPTAGLDGYSQAELIDLLRRAQRDRGMSIVLATHDLGVVAELADRVLVMYRGQVVESGPTESVFHDPLHPYTRTLLAAAWGGFVLPTAAGPRRLRLVDDAHTVAQESSKGCRFEGACAIAQTGAAGTEHCSDEEPALRSARGHAVRCHVAEGSA